MGIQVSEAIAITVFMGWLTSREEAAGPFSLFHSPEQVPELIKKFCEAQGWEFDDKRYAEVVQELKQNYPDESRNVLREAVIGTPETAPIKRPARSLDSKLKKLSVLLEDLKHLMQRMEQGTLVSVSEHQEAIEEIHEAQRLLSDCETYAMVRIVTRAAPRQAMNGYRSQSGLRQW